MAEENNERTYFGIKLTGKEDVKKSQEEIRLFNRYKKYLRMADIPKDIVEQYKKDLEMLKRNFVVIFLLFSLFSCKSVEERIKDHSYTQYWFDYQDSRYQVYKTKKGNCYIIIINKKENKLKRKYLHLKLVNKSKI